MKCALPEKKRIVLFPTQRRMLPSSLSTTISASSYIQSSPDDIGDLKQYVIQNLGKWLQHGSTFKRFNQFIFFMVQQSINPLLVGFTCDEFSFSVGYKSCQVV